MRHRNTTLKLSRPTAQRVALLKNLAESFLLHEKVVTTEAKARAVQKYVEPLITKAKVNSLTVRRELLSSLPTQRSVKKVLEIIGPRFASRNGGYTRITKLPVRRGDAAHMAIIELV